MVQPARAAQEVGGPPPWRGIWLTVFREPTASQHLGVVRSRRSDNCRSPSGTSKLGGLFLSGRIIYPGWR